MRRIAGDSAFLRKSKSEEKVALTELHEYTTDWFIDGKSKGHSNQSLRTRQKRLDKFLWFLEYRQHRNVGVTEIKAFLVYLQCAHESPEGRWCNASLREPMRPIMVCNYYRIVKAFFNFLFEEELIDFNPVQRVKMPKAQTEIKEPVSNEDIVKLIHAAKLSPSRRREEAIVLTLLDTGMRAAELCGLKQRDFDRESLGLQIVGKGNKKRMVRISPKTYKAIQTYVRSVGRDEDAPLFRSHKGRLNPSGLYQIMKRLSKIAGIPNPGCHALRRSFAVNMLRNGANAFSVQILMGHSDLTMTRRYCRIAEADIVEQHRKHSPVEMLKF